MIRNILLLTLWLFGSISARAYSYKITAPGEWCELRDYLIHRIYKDSDGFIWLGTGTSVERYDGTQNKIYTFDVPEKGYATFLVNALTERTKNDYWVGNSMGLWRLDDSRQKVVRMFPSQINFPVNALAVDKNKHLYIGSSNGLYVLSDTLRRMEVDDGTARYTKNSVKGINVTDKGDVWVLSRGGVSVIPHGTGTPKFYPCTLPATGDFRTMALADNHLFIGTEQGALVDFNLLTYQYSFWWKGAGVPVTSISCEKEMMAVGTDGQGIHLFSLPHKVEVYSVTKDDSENHGLLSDYISCVLLSDGNIWCGTDYYLGFNLLRNVTTPFYIYRNGGFTSENLSVRSAFYKDGRMYIGTREGLYVSDERTGKTLFYKPQKGGLRSNLIFSIGEYQGMILVGTCRGGLSVYNPLTGNFVDHPLSRRLTKNDIFMFLTDTSGRLWIAALDGLFCYDGKTLKEYNVVNSGLPGNIVYSVIQDSRGHFWVGTDKGAVLFNPSTGTCRPAVSGDYAVNTKEVRFIGEGTEGRMCFFTLKKNELFVTNRLQSSVTRFPDFHSFNMRLDKTGNYWMGSDYGIIKGDRLLKKFTLYSVEELVKSIMGASAGASLATYKDGLFAMPCTKGLVIINPYRVSSLPPYRITRMDVNGESYADASDMKKDTVLSLNHRQNNVTFSFMSLNYESSDLLHSQYMLEGRDTAWQMLRGKNEVSYYNLPAGNYVFKVRRIFDDSSVSEVAFSVGYDWSFILGCVLGVLLTGAGIYMYIKRKWLWTLLEERLDKMRKKEEPAVTDTPSYTNVSEEELLKTADLLRLYMENDKPYLNKDLKQSDVAQALGCSSYVLSAVFNRLRVGYYDYVNSYRITEFKRIVKEDDSTNYTLLALAERCGFKSKTSFFRSFKKQVGMTPSEYIHESQSGKH